MRTSTIYPKLPRQLKHLFLQFCRSQSVEYEKFWLASKSQLLPDRIGPCKPEILSDVSSNLFLLDYCIVWFSYYSEALTAALIIQSSQDENKYQRSSINLISWRITAELIAIRKLVLSGLDVPAKQILRSMSENLDALSLAAVDSNFCADFVKDQDVEHSNKTWYKYISKGKVRSHVNEQLPANLRELLSHHEEFRKQEETVLSAAAHPSFMSGFASLFPNYDEKNDEDDIGISPSFSLFSIRTIRYCSYRVMIHCFLDLSLLKTYEKYIDDASHEELFDLKNFVKAGRKIAVSSLVLWRQLAGPETLEELLGGDTL